MDRIPLPIDAHLEAIGKLLAEHGSLVIVAEPGAGKTTRVPPALVDRGLAGARGQVVVLQPRRIAARMAAQRIAQERGETVGGFAGYQVRFDSRVGARTRVRVITEGILTRELQRDPSLEGVAVVVLDEFHERSLHADLALALCAQVQRTLRPDLRIVVMSATLEAEPVAKFLGGAPIVRVEGRSFPIEIERCEVLEDRPLHVRAAASVRRALAGGEGDVLVFLPGVGEILRTQGELAGLAQRQDLAVLPLYGDLRPEEQDRALAPMVARKVILATNVAETSLTVPGVRAVVDTGLARSASHDPGRGIDRLELVSISRASATQRAGRAGRLGPGRVYRMWSAAQETQMRDYDLPEIRRVDLCGAVLELHVWGERDLRAFRWFEAPETQALALAERLLVRLGALDPQSLAATSLAARLASVPAHPRLARLLHEGVQRGVLAEAALCAALLSERDVVRTRSGQGARLPSGPSDLLARCDLLLGREGGGAVELDRNLARNVERVQADLERAAVRAFGEPSFDAGHDEEALLRAIFAGFPDRVARTSAPGTREGRMVGGTGIVLGPESVLDDEPLFVVLDADLGARGERQRAKVRQASAVDRAWLEEVAGGALRLETQVCWDEVRERVVATRSTLYEDLVLDEVEVADLDRGRSSAMVREAAAREPERALALDGSVERLLARLASLAHWMPELALPPLGPASLIDAAESWSDGLVSFAQLRALPWTEIVLAQLDARQRRALEEHAPEALTTPAGSTRRLEYAPGKPPVLAVRLQELFGLARTPTVAAGRVNVLLHLLAPNQQVVQVTSDLASFWNTTYAQVRKDLRARYPKHSWPEDPWTAPPTSRAKRRS